MLRKFNQKGFTLIELMIVIAIIGILAAIAIPNFISYRDKAYCSRAEQDAQSVLAAMAAYFSDPNHTSTPSLTDLENLESLSLNNTPVATYAAISGDAGGGGTVAAIISDASGRCPRDTYFTSEMGGSVGDWN